MAGYGLNMKILVPNIIRCGKQDLSFEVRHKAYARPLAAILTKCFDHLLSKKEK